MDKPKKLAPLAVRLDPDVRDAIEAMAAAEGRSISNYINYALRQHVEGSKASKPGKTKG